MIILLIILGLIGGYLGCGVLAYGLTIGYYQRHFWDVREPTKDVVLARCMFLTGPVSVILVYLWSEFGYHGLLYRPTVSTWVATKTVNPEEDRLASAHVRQPDKERR